MQVYVNEDLKEVADYESKNLEIPLKEGNNTIRLELIYQGKIFDERNIDIEYKNMSMLESTNDENMSVFQKFRNFILSLFTALE